MQLYSEKRERFNQKIKATDPYYSMGSDREFGECWYSRSVGIQQERAFSYS